MSEYKSRNVAIVCFDRERLVEIMGFPLGTRILGVRDSFEQLGNDGKIAVEMLVEHDNISACPAGGTIPRITPTYTDERFGGIFRPEFKSW